MVYNIYSCNSRVLQPVEMPQVALFSSLFDKMWLELIPLNLCLVCQVEDMVFKEIEKAIVHKDCLNYIKGMDLEDFV